MHVAFDIGNVLCDLHIEKFTNALQKYLPSGHKAISFLEQIQALQDCGLTTVQQSLESRLQIRSEEQITELLDAWYSTVSPNEMMLNFLDNLKSEGIKIALLSNMGQEHGKYLRNNFPKLFENTIEHLSFEVGARKPSNLYYQSFLMDHSEFTGAVYLDDLDLNLKAGKKYSFKSFKFCLDQLKLVPISKQKQELEKIKTLILDRKYDYINGPKFPYVDTY